MTKNNNINIHIEYDIYYICMYERLHTHLYLKKLAQVYSCYSCEKSL